MWPWVGVRDVGCWARVGLGAANIALGMHACISAAFTYLVSLDYLQDRHCDTLFQKPESSRLSYLRA